MLNVTLSGAPPMAHQCKQRSNGPSAPAKVSGALVVRFIFLGLVVDREPNSYSSAPLKHCEQCSYPDTAPRDA